MDNAADKEMADESTKKYQRLKRKYQKQAEDAEDPQNAPTKHRNKEKKNRK